MVPQSSQVFNSDYFDSIIQKINAAESCVDLESVSSDALKSLGALRASITDQLAALQPILALLEAPSANPAAIVTWISSFITGFLTPYTLPSVNYALQLTEISTQLTSIMAAISAKQAQFPSCSVSLPSVG